MFPEVTVVDDGLLSGTIEAVLESAVTHNDRQTPRVEGNDPSGAVFNIRLERL